MPGICGYLHNEAISAVLRLLVIGDMLENKTITTKNLSHDNQSRGRGLNPEPHEYEAGVLITRLGCSVL
jgi:hypothetical protein